MTDDTGAAAAVAPNASEAEATDAAIERIVERLTAGVDERVDARMAGINDQVAAQVREALESWSAEDRERTIDHALGRAPNLRPPAHGVDAAHGNGGYELFADYLRDIRVADARGETDPRLRALAEGTDADGGYLVPDEFRQQLLEVMLEDAVIRPRAFVIPMDAKTIKIPAIDDTSHASNVYGGVQAAWTGEANQVPEGDPTFREVELNAHKLALYTQASNELVNDSPLALEALLTRLYGKAFAWFEDSAFLDGDDSGKPQGLLRSAAKVTVAKTKSQAADTITVVNIDKMWSRLLPSSKGRAVWLANPDTYPQLAAIARTGDALSNPVVINGDVMTINGRPVLDTEHCKTLGDEGDLILADLDYYVIGDRERFEMSMSDHYRFRNDQRAWLATERVDGHCWLNSALTPANGANTLSAVVTLAERA